MESTKVFHGKKTKKKQVKDELDRIKQAEKKRRRLEKALATSAAIRSELEKKKEKKRQEEQRLDQEGAAIAEAVALQVLLEEDSDDKSRIILKESNIGIFMNGSTLCQESLKRYSFENVGWFSADFGHMSELNLTGRAYQGVPHHHLEDESFNFPDSWDRGEWGPDDISAGHIAAQAVSSLQIGEDDRVFFSQY